MHMSGLAEINKMSSHLEITMSERVEPPAPTHATAFADLVERFALQKSYAVAIVKRKKGACAPFLIPP
jgi:hypothetical protein